ncbi:MAG: hypothetical protein ACRENB_10615 [Gemmatimonadales bacterium]
MSKTPRSGLAFGGLLAVLAAGSAAAQQVEIKPEKAPKPDKYLITAEEVTARTDIQNAMDAVKRLRSAWLKPVRPRGNALSGMDPNDPYKPIPADCKPRDARPECGGSSGSSSDPSGIRVSGDAYGGAESARKQTSGLLPVLYIDEVKQERVDELENIRAGQIFEIRYLTGTLASGRYGAGHEAGAILLKTHRIGNKP